MASRLIDICSYAKGKTTVAGLTAQNYISTENMLPNKAGITTASSLPTINQTQSFKTNDFLISNIRPYFKKIWYATFDGGCSNDVLVLRANNGNRQGYANRAGTAATRTPEDRHHHALRNGKTAKCEAGT